MLTNSTKANRFDHEEIKEVMDLCLSCKGCKSECPSNVDMAKLKAEFLQHYYDANGVPFRSKLIANFSKSARLGSIVPGLYNFAVTNGPISSLIKRVSGFNVKRSMPTLYKTTLMKWWKREVGGRKNEAGSRESGSREREVGSPESEVRGQELGEGSWKSGVGSTRKRVYLFCDEFTNYNDTEIGIKAILLLENLGYEVVIPEHIESGRAWLSKGLIREAKRIANKNIKLLKDVVSAEMPLIGIEPSAILTFRDEYPDLADDDQLQAAKELSKHAWIIDEFIASEIEKGNIAKERFTKEKREIKLHGHCQQKALSSVAPSVKALSLPENYSVEVIPSGCCGMAGSFGYEKEHYDLSMKVGELVLLPAVRDCKPDTIIAAPGTSCRHQIKDGTGRKALHPVEVLYNALIE
jgi:Fe-S oxidoreductase